MDVESYEVLKDEVDKHFACDFIKESFYPSWLGKLILVKKPNGKWKTGVDFTYLNKACHKDSFLLPRIDQLTDATSRHQLLSFMDTYSGYNQIPMQVLDQEHTSFITDHNLYCYKVMPFGVKNVGATYQRLVNMMFKEHIRKMMKVYMDDMLIKSKITSDHISHLADTFNILKTYRMKLNPLKCAFSMAFRKFLGFMVNERGIEANLEKIQSLIDMQSLSRTKEVQSLTKRVAALNRFIFKATDKCLPFFDSLKGNKSLLWDYKCEQAFRALKEYLGKSPPLSKLVDDEPLFLYLAVSKYSVSGALIKEEEKIQ